MLNVRVLPRRGVPLRSALATVEITTALVVAHTWAGGALPSVTWIALMASVVFGAGLVVLRGVVRPLVALPALVAVQLLLHCWLMAMTPASHEMSGMSGMGATDPAGALHLGWPMLASHLAGAVVTAVVWELRRRAVEVLVSWTDPGLLPPPAFRRTAAPALVPTRTARRVVVAAPRRGPPSGLRLA